MMKVLALLVLVAATTVPNMSGLWTMSDGREILVFDRGDGKFAASVKMNDMKEPFIFVGYREDKNGKTILGGNTGDLTANGCSVSATFLAVGTLNKNASEFNGKAVIICAISCKGKKPYAVSELIKGKWSRRTQ